MMQAVILAGGLGTRLRPITETIPKPMVLIAGRPYLEYQIAYLRDQKMTDILLLIGYKGEHIENHFGDGESFGVRIRYSKEETPLGTGGALRHALELLDERFLLLYGDSFQPMQYADCVATFTDAGADACVVAYNNTESTDVKNNLYVDERGVVIRYDKTGVDPRLNMVEAGVSLYKKSVIERIQTSGVTSLEQDIFPKLIEEGELRAYPVRDRFYDIGTPERLAAAELFFAIWPPKNT